MDLDNGWGHYVDPDTQSEDSGAEFEMGFTVLESERDIAPTDSEAEVELFLHDRDKSCAVQQPSLRGDALSDGHLCHEFSCDTYIGDMLVDPIVLECVRCPSLPEHDVLGMTAPDVPESGLDFRIDLGWIMRHVCQFGNMHGTCGWIDYKVCICQIIRIHCTV